jgi:hypothetical protein
MSLSTFLRSLRRGSRSAATIVRVDGQDISVDMKTQPPVGATLDVGFPVIVTESRRVAGGGLLVVGERVDREVVASPE